MKRLRYEDADFSWRAMRPEEGDDLTAIWGRKIAKNLLSGYALIGTAVIDQQETVRIGLPLYRRYKYPPAVFLLWKDVTDGDDADTLGWKTNSEGGQYRRDIMVTTIGDGVLLRNGLEHIGKKIMVVYKIHGV